MEINEIINELQNIPGLGNVKLLNGEQKKAIMQLEENCNTGVKECLDRKFTILLTHDSTFRDPAGKIVLEKNDSIEFPAVPFPEAKGKDVVSSSPSAMVHNAIVKRLNMRLEREEATLLIGLNL